MLQSRSAMMSNYIKKIIIITTEENNSYMAILPLQMLLLVFLSFKVLDHINYFRVDFNLIYILL